MRRLLLLIMTLSCLVTIGCSVPRLPKRTDLAPSTIPELSSNNARVFFYPGYLINGWHKNRLEGLDCELFIDDKPISYFNSEDAVILDLPSGSYNVTYRLYFTNERAKNEHKAAPYKLTVATGDTVYLEANSKYISNTTADVAAVAAGPIGVLATAHTTYYSDYLEEDKAQGPEFIKKMRIADYHDLSK